MKIYIPSRGRPDKTVTADCLDEAGIDYTVVCTKGDPKLEEYYSRFSTHQILVVPTNNLAEKRQAILAQAPGKHIQFDDDLRFYARESEGSFYRADPDAVIDMVDWFDDALSHFAHAGLVDKFMSQTRPRGVIHGGRYNAAFGYNKKLFPKPYPRFRTITNQEHDMHLQLLVAGRLPAISCEFSKDAKYYSAGGCSTYRTPALERKVFKQLTDLWPRYVKLRKTKHSISGIAATFNWRLAAKDGGAV